MGYKNEKPKETNAQETLNKNSKALKPHNAISIKNQIRNVQARHARPQKHSPNKVTILGKPKNKTTANVNIRI